MEMTIKQGYPIPPLRFTEVTANGETNKLTEFITDAINDYWKKADDDILNLIDDAEQTVTVTITLGLDNRAELKAALAAAGRTPR